MKATITAQTAKKVHRFSVRTNWVLLLAVVGDVGRNDNAGRPGVEAQLTQYFRPLGEEVVVVVVVVVTVGVARFCVRRVGGG